MTSTILNDATPSAIHDKSTHHVRQTNTLTSGISMKGLDFVAWMGSCCSKHLMTLACRTSGCQIRASGMHHITHASQGVYHTTRLSPFPSFCVEKKKSYQLTIDQDIRLRTSTSRVLLVLEERAQIAMSLAIAICAVATSVCCASKGR